MNVDTKTLDGLAVICYGIHQNLDAMREKANRSGAGRLAGDIETIRERAVVALNTLVGVGATDPEDAQRAENGTHIAPVPLQLLDTPANRELLRCLLLTMDAALAVDKERGHDGDGFAEVIEHFAAGVQTEIYGPADLRQGAGKEQ